MAHMVKDGSCLCVVIEPSLFCALTLNSQTSTSLPSLMLPLLVEGAPCNFFQSDLHYAISYPSFRSLLKVQ